FELFLERSEKKEKKIPFGTRAAGYLETGLQKLGRIYHEAARYRRPVGAPPAVAATAAPAPLPFSRTQAIGLPEDSHRHPVRPQDRDCVGRPAGRTGVWLRQDVPRLPESLAPSRCLGQAARRVAGRTERRGPDRLGPRRDRRFLRQGTGRG